MTVWNKALCLSVLAFGCGPDAGLRVFNASPIASILSPSSDGSYASGVTLVVEGSVSDPDHAESGLVASVLVDGLPSLTSVGAWLEVYGNAVRCQSLVDTLIDRLEALGWLGSD